MKKIPTHDPQTGELNPYYKELTGKKNPLQLEIPFKEHNVPFVNEVEEFNHTFGKPNNYKPTIPDRKEWMFVYDFIMEELEEYKEACEKGDIVEVLDALCDITYVSIGNGTMLHGLKDRIWKAYQEVQASNMSKACKTTEEAVETCKREAERIGEATHFEKVGEYYIVYRNRDKKVLKSYNYFRPDLKQFFTKEELDNV
jgi:predicted HAD superfamily Cof-like phosphohydrolase